MNLTLAQLNALPAGSAVRCTTERGTRTVLALKIGGYGREANAWATTDGAMFPTSFAISQAEPVLLEPTRPEPTTFATPGDLQAWLHETDIVEPFSHLLRDANDRPWIATWSEDDPFVISYPEESDEGDTPERSTYHGDLDLPTYPVRLVQEAGA